MEAFLRFLEPWWPLILSIVAVLCLIEGVVHYLILRALRETNRLLKSQIFLDRK